MNTKDQLNSTWLNFTQRAPQKTLEAFANFQKVLENDRIGKTYLKEGDTIPSFTLTNSLGKSVSSEDLLKKGPIVISFYRGSWCPYCNIELKGYQDILNDIHNKGAEFVAISPELPDESLSLSEKLDLDYIVLSDFDNQLAEKFGIVFKLNQEVSSIYKGYKIDLNSTQGNEKNRLPIPATYVVSQEGKIIFADVNVDYVHRYEPIEVLKYL